VLLCTDRDCERPVRPLERPVRPQDDSHVAIAFAIVFQVRTSEVSAAHQEVSKNNTSRANPVRSLPEVGRWCREQLCVLLVTDRVRLLVSYH